MPNEDARGFGDVGTYIEYVEDVDRIINNVYQSKHLYGKSGPRCPKKDNGCGGKVKKLERMWLEHSDEGRPLNNLGRKVAPPRRPRFTGVMPIEPLRPELEESPPPAGEEQVLARYRNSLREQRGKIFGYAWVFSILVILIWVLVSCANSRKGSQGEIAFFAFFALGGVWLVAFAWLAVVADGLATVRDRDLKAQVELDRKAARLSKVAEEEALETYHQAMEVYRRDLDAFQSEEKRYAAAMRRYTRFKEQWKELWHCEDCGKHWSDSVIDREEFTDID